MQALRQGQILASLRDVNKTYGAIPALADFGLEVRSGELLALVGPNGAGKSTAVGLMLGLLTPDAGVVELMGLPPTSLLARLQIGVMLQSAGIPETLRVGELLELTRSYYAHPRSIADCVALAGLDGLLERRYGRLSGGQQRRVQFALALCGRPRLLFLDEPTTGLDVQARLRLWQAIRELVAQGCGVLLTTHYLEEAESLADRIQVIQRGRTIAQGSVAQIRAHVAQRRIRCTSTLSATTVAGWPHVRSAQGQAGRLEIVADVVEPVVRLLLDADPALQDLEIERAGLVDAFMQLTQEAA